MRALSTMLVLALLVVPAAADWSDGDYWKWLQPPDLTPDGIDVNATYPKVLADDFECTERMLITDAHIWASWKYREGDQGQQLVDKPAAEDLRFHLSFHPDVPKTTETPWSMPGPPEWVEQASYWDGTGPQPAVYFTERVFSTVPGEGWYDPNTGEYIEEDHDLVWQYNFYIDPAVAWEQQGDSANPIIYWLNVSCEVPEPLIGEPPFMFGWKTADPGARWNDDAVVGHFDAAGQLLGDWVDLHYPDGHPLEGETLDLAFVITPEPCTWAVMTLGAAFVLGRRRRR